MIKQISVIVIMTAVIVYGKVISVPGDFGTIQEGINNSAHTDTVLVSPGVYYENINFSGKNITLASLFLTTRDTSYTSQTIINGGGTGRVVNISNGESADTKLIGFTIMNGYSSYGSGIRILSSSPVISDNIIKDNQMGWYGEGCGIYLKHSSSTIYNNKIINNDGAYYGGGIAVDSSASVEILNNIITKHTTNSGYGVAYGAGISVMSSGGIKITKNLLYTNNVDFGEGDIISIINSDAEINKCTFYNTSTSGSTMAVYESQLTMKNSIIWSDVNFQGLAIDSSHFKSSLMNISYCNFNEATEGEGNISINPKFKNLETFGLQFQSPCINSGDPVSEPDPDGTIADMGWMPFNLSGYGTVSGTVTLDEGLGTMESVWIESGDEICRPLPTGDYVLNMAPGVYNITANLSAHESQTVENITVNPDEETTGVNFHLTNNSLAGIIEVSKDGTKDFTIIQDAVNVVLPGDTILVHDGIYEESLVIRAKYFHLTSNYMFTGDSLSINNTIIDGKSEFRPLFVEDCPDTNLAFTGITIQNGYDYSKGGGCCIINSSPTFKNCTIQNNVTDLQGGAFYYISSSASLKNCIIKENTAEQGGAFYNNASEISIYDSEVINNSAYNSGALDNYNSDAYIENSVIRGNSANYNGAICNTFDSELVLISNIITENSSESSIIDFDRYNKQGLVMNNLITNNIVTGNSIIIYIRDSSPIFINNTITGNKADEGRGPIYIYSQNPPYSRPSFYNNVIWNNTSADSTQITIYDDDTCPNFYNNLIQYGKENFKFLYNATPENNIGDYINNIDLDPLFEGSSNYILSNNSPCINAGTEQIPDSISFPQFDVDGNARLYLSSVDIGAFEWPGLGIEDNTIPLTTELHQNYPNPFNPVTTIRYSLSTEAQVKLTVFDITGREVAELVSEKQAKGNHEIKFNGESLTSGLYLFRLSVNDKVVQSRKMMMLK
ncbi:TPA: hypothetical protein DCR49_01995 [Candidatus Delongbacteria bacterium]|nr:hypothetical protein [Candidatus Delongbacteria bacterium]